MQKVENLNKFYTNKNNKFVISDKMKNILEGNNMNK